MIKERTFQVDDDFRKGSKRYKHRKAQQPQKAMIELVKIEKATITEETISVKLFSEKIGKPVSDILKKLLLLVVCIFIIRTFVWFVKRKEANFFKSLLLED